MEENDLLTAQDVARAAGDVGAAAVRQWERTGKLRAIRTASGIRLFRRDDVEHLLAIRATAPRRKGAL